MDKPVRKVHSNGRTVVGLVSSKKNIGVQFESSLEENFLYLLSFDDKVKNYVSQPVRIPHTDENGRKNSYVPDFLVEYHERPSVLFEVKTREWLKQNREKHRVKMKAAQEFAGEKGWEFRVITDKELKTEFVRNVRTLFRFQDYPINQAAEDFIRDKLPARGMQIVELVKLAGDDGPLILATIWAMLFEKRLWCNLSKKLTMQSKVTLRDGLSEMKYRYHDTV